MDLSGDSSDESANIQIYNFNNTDAQRNFKYGRLIHQVKVHYLLHLEVHLQKQHSTGLKQVNTKVYDLKIWNGTYWAGDAYKVILDQNGTSVSINLPLGYYEAYIDSKNNYSYKMSNVVKFTVKNQHILLEI